MLPFPGCACCCFSRLSALLHLVCHTPPRQQHRIQPAAAAIYTATSTVHHSCSRPASAIKAKQQRKQAPTGSPSPSGGVIPVVSRFLSLSLALGEQAIRQNHRQPSQQSPARSKHTAHLRTAPATPPRPPPPPPPAPSPRPRARARTTRSIITQKHPLAARPCKNGRRRARYAHPQSYLPPIAVRLPPAPAHSLVKMPNASAAPVSLLPLPPTSPKHARISHLTPSVQTSAALLSACLAHRLHKH